MTCDQGQAPRESCQDVSSLGPCQLAAALHTPVASLYRARELGLLPDPGPAGRWAPAAAAEITRHWPQTAAAVEAARELGAARSAELLARLTGLPVTAAHITGLAARTVLTQITTPPAPDPPGGARQ